MDLYYVVFRKSKIFSFKETTADCIIELRKVDIDQLHILDGITDSRSAKQMIKTGGYTFRVKTIQEDGYRFQFYYYLIIDLEHSVIKHNDVYQRLQKYRRFWDIKFILN